MRLIDIDAQKKRLNRLQLQSEDLKGAIELFLETSETVDAEPVKHGRWKGKPIAGYSTVRCSVCGEVYTENNGRWLYCPNCGSKMNADVADKSYSPKYSPLDEVEEGENEHIN